MVTAHEVPAPSTMAVPHGPSGVGTARRRMREELLAGGTRESVVDDAVLVLSELLSNSCRHARPLANGTSVRASWRCDPHGGLTISVTDGGGPTKPLPATPSVSARGGRGLAIISALARDWGVEEQDTAEPGPHGGTGVTVWVELPSRESHPAGRHGRSAGRGAARARRHPYRTVQSAQGAEHGGTGDLPGNIPFDIAAVEELR